MTREILRLHGLAVAAFWISLGGALYSYLGFPALARALGLLRRPRPLTRGDGRDWPAVTVLVVCYNEAASIGAKLDNILASSYPGSLDVIVVSDASTDGTDDIVRAYPSDRVTLLVQPQRRGKSAGLNRAVPLARGRKLIFTDANAAFQPDTIQNLVRYFGAARTGLVTGFTRYRAEAGPAATVRNVYTTIERTIKTAESRFGCCVGADGAIFAMRRNLFRPLRDDDINDLVIPLDVIEQGHGCMFAQDAYCSEAPVTSIEGAFRRQSRITNRTLRALWRHAGLLNPLRFGWFSFFLFSHKVVRFLMPPLLVASVIAAGVLFEIDFWFHEVVLAGLAALVLGMLLGNTVEPLRRPWKKVTGMATTFVTLNAAMLYGWWKFLTGQTDVTWQPEREKR